MAASLLENCSIGIQLNIDCHKSGASAVTQVLLNIKDMSQEKQDLLSLRTELSMDNLQTVCSHHEKIFLTHFEHSQWKCCDPLGRHKSAIRSSLRSVSLASAKKLKEAQITVKPGEKLCPTCRKLLVVDSVEYKEPDPMDDVDFIPIDKDKMDLDSSFTDLGCSPLKVHGVRDKKTYAKRKI